VTRHTSLKHRAAAQRAARLGEFFPAKSAQRIKSQHEQTTLRTQGQALNAPPPYIVRAIGAGRSRQSCASHPFQIDGDGIMRTSVLALAALVGGLSATPASAAISYPWCTRYANTAGECSFNTFEQCLETLSGIGGVCTSNPGYTGPAGPGPYNAVPRRHIRPY
jgi:hypothetical protein